MTASESCYSSLTFVDIPSRTVLRSCVSEEATLRAVSNTSLFLIHFDDIRDAIDVVMRTARDKHSDSSVRLSTLVAEPANDKTEPPPLIHSIDASAVFGALKMNQLFEVKEAAFACSVSAEQVLKEKTGDGISLSSASVMITISFDTVDSVEFEIVDPLVVEIEKNFTNFGPILAKSDVKRDIATGTVFKFFVEFYRVQDCQRFLDSVNSIVTEHAEIKFENITLYDVDRESLFFSSPLTPSSSTLTIERSNSDHSHSHARRDSISSSSNDEVSSFASFDANFEIDLWKIECGLEKRTTCMIRNIPNKYTQQMVLDMVNETHKECFDFLYLRMDFRNHCNVGYAFINFTNSKHILSFWKRVCGRRWARFNSDKICTLTFARIQGTQALIDKFRHSKVMFEAPAYRPKLFYVNGDSAGQEAPFPGTEY